MNLGAVFINQFGRLRSGWRFAVFLCLFILVGLLFGSVVASVLLAFNIGYQAGTAAFLTINGVVSLTAALLVGWFAGKWLEGLPFKALGALPAGKWLRHLGVGLGTGASAIVLAVAVAAIGGYGIEINPADDSNAIARNLLLSLGILAAAAAFEEAFFRGYMLQTFTRAGLAWPAIGLTAIIFGAVHYGNPYAGLTSSINTALAGVWFGVAYLKTRDLWFPFGMHLSWNWVQGPIFGIEISGLTDITRTPLFREIDDGPEWLTGGAYGIEGGVACTAAILVSILVIYFVPFLKPSEEMLELTSCENPRPSGF